MTPEGRAGQGPVRQRYTADQRTQADPLRFASEVQAWLKWMLAKLGHLVVDFRSLVAIDGGGLQKHLARCTPYVPDSSQILHSVRYGASLQRRVTSGLPKACRCRGLGI